MTPLLIPYAVLADKRLGNSAARLLLCQMMRDGITPKTLDVEATADFYDVTPQTVRNWVKHIKSLPGYAFTGEPDARFQCEGKREKPKPSVSNSRIMPILPLWANDATKESMIEFFQHRRKIKKPVSTKPAAVRLCNKLDKLAAGDNELAVQIITRSIDSGKWYDLYPLAEAKAEGWDF